MVKIFVKIVYALYGLYQSLKMTYKRKRFRLKHVHPTFIMNGGGQISRDFVAHEYSMIGRDCDIGPMVELGPYSMLGPRVVIVGGDHNFRIPGMPIIFSGMPERKKTSIEADVWVGSGSIIKSGVTIGKGAIVATGSVVLNNIPPFEIYGGNPAKKIFNRFFSERDREIHDAMLARKPFKGRYVIPILYRFGVGQLDVD